MTIPRGRMTIPLEIKELLEIEAYRRTIRTLDYAYDVDLANACTPVEREKAEYRHHWETLLYYEQIAEIKTRRLCRKADRLGIPTGYAGDNSPMWRRSSQLNSWILTPLGYSEVQNMILQECKDRRERATTWAGVIIGLLRVWLLSRHCASRVKAHVVAARSSQGSAPGAMVREGWLGTGTLATTKDRTNRAARTPPAGPTPRAEMTGTPPRRRQCAHHGP